MAGNRKWDSNGDEKREGFAKFTQLDVKSSL